MTNEKTTATDSLCDSVRKDALAQAFGLEIFPELPETSTQEERRERCIQMMDYYDCRESLEESERSALDADVSPEQTERLEGVRGFLKEETFAKQMQEEARDEDMMDAAHEEALEDNEARDEEANLDEEECCPACGPIDTAEAHQACMELHAEEDRVEAEQIARCAKSGHLMRDGDAESGPRGLPQCDRCGWAPGDPTTEEMDEADRATEEEERSEAKEARLEAIVGLMKEETLDPDTIVISRTQRERRELSCQLGEDLIDPLGIWTGAEIMSHNGYRVQVRPGSRRRVSGGTLVTVDSIDGDAYIPTWEAPEAGLIEAADDKERGTR